MVHQPWSQNPLDQVSPLLGHPQSSFIESVMNSLPHGFVRSQSFMQGAVDLCQETNQQDDLEENARCTSDKEAAPAMVVEDSGAVPGSTLSSQSGPTPQLVQTSWDTEDDPANPKNFSLKLKWLTTALVSLFTFTTMMTSTMLAPALPQISRDLHIASEATTQLTLSIYVLGYAFGPFVWAPLSELFGRRVPIQIGSTWYLIWNLVCGFSYSKSFMISGRLLSSIGGAAGMAIGIGILSDVWPAEQRGRSLGVYALMPLLAPTLGPIFGGHIVQHTTWRWAFWASASFSALVQLVAFFFLKETHAPTILRHKAERLGTATRQSLIESTTKIVLTTLLRTLHRPLKLLTTHPPITLLSLNGLTFGTLYIVLSTLPTLFTTQYAQTDSTASLNYISLGIGLILGAQIFAPLTDILHRRLRSNPKYSQRLPELRIVAFLPATLLAAIGLLILGWSAQRQTYWLVPNLGILIFGIGNQVATQCTNAYVIDAYGPRGYSASAMAGIWFVKSLAGFGFPLFGPDIFKVLGWGWGYTVLAVGVLVVGGPVGAGIWYCGQRWREKGEKRFNDEDCGCGSGGRVSPGRV